MTITRYTPLADLPEFLTPEEYRAFMGISRAKAYDDIASGKVPSVQVGRLYRIPKSAFMAMAREGQTA